MTLLCENKMKYQPSGAGGTHSPIAKPHRLQNQNGRQGPQKWPTRSGHFKQLSINKFFDPSTPSMRKGDDREKNWGKSEKE